MKSNQVESRETNSWRPKVTNPLFALFGDFLVNHLADFLLNRDFPFEIACNRSRLGMFSVVTGRR
jgi:hypothetical protein